MKYIYYITFLLICSLTLSCEKLNLDQDKPTEENKKTDNSTNTTNSIYDVEANNSGAPYTVADIISGRFLNAFENPDSIRNVHKAYVKGYIVGFVQGTSMSTAKFSTGDIESNIIIADYINENDIYCCIPVQLPKGTSIRATLNLSDNPDVLGKKYLFVGTLSDYMNVIGLKKTSSKMYLINENSEYKDITDDEEDEGDDDNGNTQASDISTVSGLADVPIPNKKWVEGYIVGYVPRKETHYSKIVFDVPTESIDITNIAIADTPNEGKAENCVVIQLTKGKNKFDSRTGLNLYDNPENLHKRVRIHGEVQVYMAKRGLVDVDNYIFPQ